MAKKRPFGITILSIIGFISAFIMAGIGAVFILLGGAGLQGTGVNVAALGALSAFFGVIMLGGGILQGIISYGLWKMQKWAYYVSLVMYAIAFLGALMSVSIVGIVIDGLMVYYLYSVRKKF